MTLATLILCAIASVIVSLAVGTVLRKGGAAADDPPRYAPEPAHQVDQDVAP